MNFTLNNTQIGDILLYQLSSGVWADTTVDLEDLKYLENKPEDFKKNHKPIKLNHDVLTQFQYKQVTSNTDNYYAHLKSDFRIRTNCGKYSLCIDHDDTATIHFFHTFEFLHELQQIFRVLEKSELVEFYVGKTS